LITKKNILFNWPSVLLALQEFLFLHLRVKEEEIKSSLAAQRINLHIFQSLVFLEQQN